MLTSNAKKPVTCIIGGSKISTKIGVLSNLINKMENSENLSNTSNNYSFKIIYEQTTITVHFDKNTLNLIGWTTNDIYQNRVETKISNVEKNLMINNKIFKIQNYIN